MSFTLNVNGIDHVVDATPDTPLLWVLRDHLELTGTKYGCGMALCGAFTVYVDGQPTRSCVTPVSQVQDKKVITIEDKTLLSIEAVQEAWEDLGVAQCGYCQSGQIMAAAALIKTNRNPSDADIDAAMSGNICRCSSYQRIRAGIKHAAILLLDKDC